MTDDCSQNTDPLKLVREGASQDDRVSAALDPASAPVNAHSVAQQIVFAQAYAQWLLRYKDDLTPAPGGWDDYFGSDTAVPLATAAIEDVDAYTANVRAWFDFLNDLGNQLQTDALKDRLGYLFAVIGALAQGLDNLEKSLPDTVALKSVLRNLFKSQLAPALNRLIGYYKGGHQGVGIPVLLNDVAPSPTMQVLHGDVDTFAKLLGAGLSADWWGNDLSWGDHLNNITADVSIYGDTSLGLFAHINHGVTHPLFRSVFDQFLKVFMRVVSEAQAGLADTLNQYSGHAPHYALYLAFLQLLEHARSAGNTLTQRHLDFYYATVLGLKPKPSQPGYVHLVAELAKQADSVDFPVDQLFKAGKDSAGKNAFFANVGDFVANKATLAGLKTVYRHGSTLVSGTSIDEGRFFASPVANSDDGQGAPLTSIDKSWHPFFNKIYANGAISHIDMPPAQIGFAISSHYLLAAEGNRTITVTLTPSSPLPYTPIFDYVDPAGFGLGGISRFGVDGFLSLESMRRPVRHALESFVRCSLTTAKGWLVQPSVRMGVNVDGNIELVIELDGAADAIAPYSTKVHGYNFDTDLPLLLVTLVQDANPYAYAPWQDVAISTIDLQIDVTGIKTLAVSNDFGSIDLSKPFQPFGTSPIAGSSLIVGSKEIFQKQLTSARIDLAWQVVPTVFPGPSMTDFAMLLAEIFGGEGSTVPQTSMPSAHIDFLQAGAWVASGESTSIAPGDGSDTTRFTLNKDDLGKAISDEPDFTPNEAYGTQQRHGYVRLRLDGGIGQDNYQAALLNFLQPKSTASNPGKPPQGPVAAALTMNYSASSKLTLNTVDETTFTNRPGRFFHLAPFGTAERHAYLSNGGDVPLLPQFRLLSGSPLLESEAEFYIGIAGLAPPQNLSLLFQVVDGTANPLVSKPVPHFEWSYLADDQWCAFGVGDVIDATDEWLNAGIVTLSIPSDATSDNRLLPSGAYWVRVAVSQASDAVCRLQLVAAQAMKAKFSDQGNAPDFSATPLPAGTVTQLAVPNAAVKSIAQPYPSFGGRGAEQRGDFYRRVSERLRHKDRAIDLWDYERLILEAFPQIYKVKCLNHTCYEPSDNASGIYRELAPGHVTIVTLPNLTAQPQIDPLKPYTSLGLLKNIQTFLETRCGCFATLHLKNPQFESVRVTCNLKLREGYDESYYTKQLKQAITRFLSPWAFDGGGMPSFDGKIYKSVLIHFVETQPYVDYVTDFQLFQDIPGQPKGSVDLDEVSGSRAVSILVSAPADSHAITTFEVAPDLALSESCGCGT